MGENKKSPTKFFIFLPSRAPDLPFW